MQFELSNMTAQIVKFFEKRGIVFHVAKAPSIEDNYVCTVSFRDCEQQSSYGQIPPVYAATAEAAVQQMAKIIQIGQNANNNASDTTDLSAETIRF